MFLPGVLKPGANTEPLFFVCLLAARMSATSEATVRDLVGVAVLEKHVDISVASHIDEIHEVCVSIVSCFVCLSTIL